MFTLIVKQLPTLVTKPRYSYVTTILIQSIARSSSLYVAMRLSKRVIQLYCCCVPTHTPLTHLFLPYMQVSALVRQQNMRPKIEMDRVRGTWLGPWCFRPTDPHVWRSAHHASLY